MRIRYALAAILVLAPAAAAAMCAPPGPPLSTTTPALFETLASASGPQQAYVAENAIWVHWTAAPDATAQDLLDEGMRRIRQSDFIGAEAALDALVDHCPDYAEGWNQRAYARFLQGRLDDALADITEALAREPKHFAALSGRIRILFSQGRIELARHALTDAIRINPWLRERAKLPLEPIEKKS